MHWVLVETEVGSLVDEFDSEDEGLQGVHEMLAVNAPDLVEHLALGAMYDEGESHDVELPPSLYGEALKARLAEWVQRTNADASREAHEKIRRWLAEEGWSVRDVGDPQSILNVMATLQNGTSVNIFQRDGDHGHITISQHWYPDEQFQGEVVQLQDNLQRELVWDIYKNVSVMGVEFEGHSIPPVSMRFYVQLYFDGLTKDALLQRVLLTIRAFALAIRTFLRGFEQAGRSTETAQRQLRLVS